MKKFKLSFIFIFCIVCGMIHSQEIKPFMAGERVVFLGNSITDGGHYHSFIWLYYMTHFPDRKLEIINAGVGGDQVVDMDKRFLTDVVPNKPTYLILTFGMNDTGYDKYNTPEASTYVKEKVNQSFTAFQSIEKKIKYFPNMHVALMGSSPYDEGVKMKDHPVMKGKNAAILEIIKFQKEAAKTNGWGFTSLNEPMVSINQRMQQKDSSFTLEGLDRIHPNSDGYMVMAYLFLKAQGFSNLKVADVVIDVSKKQRMKSENCAISKLKCTRALVSFNYLANSLPYPLDTIPRNWEIKTQAQGAKVTPFVKEMNQELLTINGLEGLYQLKIDGQKIGKWSAQELAQGINLAECTRTPQYQQAMAIMYLNEERWELERRYRKYTSMQYNFLEGKGLLYADNEAALDTIQHNLKKNWLVHTLYPNYTEAMFPEIRDAWEKQEQVLVSKIYEINKPRTHKIELMKVE